MTALEPGIPRYFEAHITVEPVFDERLDQLTTLANQYQFRVADLLLQRSSKVAAQKHTQDSFCTGRAKTYGDLYTRMTEMATALRTAGFQVWRQKIEAVVYDERTKE